MAANPKGEPGYENRFHNCPISGGLDLSSFRPEWLPELHSATPSGRHCRTVHGRPVRLPLPVGDLRVPRRRSGTSARQPLRAAGAPPVPPPAPPPPSLPPLHDPPPPSP